MGWTGRKEVVGKLPTTKGKKWCGNHPWPSLGVSESRILDAVFSCCGASCCNPVLCRLRQEDHRFEGSLDYNSTSNKNDTHIQTNKTQCAAFIINYSAKHNRDGFKKEKLWERWTKTSSKYYNVPPVGAAIFVVSKANTPPHTCIDRAICWPLHCIQKLMCLQNTKQQFVHILGLHRHKRTERNSKAEHIFLLMIPFCYLTIIW